MAQEFQYSKKWNSLIYQTIPFSLFCLILYWRLNSSIFDFGCPTYLGNMIWKIYDYGFPASFLSSPLIVANYHQLPLLLAAVISKKFSMHPIEALSTLLMLSGAMMYYFVSMYARKRWNMKGASWILLVVILSASVPVEFWKNFSLAKVDVGWYSYLGILDHLSGSTWSLGLINLVLIVYLFEGKRGYYWCLLLLALMSTINPTIFSVTFIAILFSIIKNKTNIFARLVCLMIVYKTTQWVPSAFYIGDNYDSPRIFIRIIQSGFFENILEIIKHSPAIILITFPIAYLNFKNARDTLYEYIFLISYLFPIIFGFDNIDNWDNYHKFVLLSTFSSFFVMSNYFSGLKKNSNKLVVILFCGFILLTSIPALYNIWNVRLNIAVPKIPIAYKDTGDQKLIQYLNQFPKVMLWPYPSGLNKCIYFSNIHTNSSVSIAGFYFDNFLLSKSYENIINIESNWYKNNYNITEIYSDYKNFIIIPSDYKEDYILNNKKNEKYLIKFESVYIVEL